jgi:hypothetical protein
MKAAIAIAIVCFCTVMLSAQHHEAETQPAIHNIRLRASVQAMAALADLSGEVTPIDFDPEFALTLRIESAVPAVPNLARGAIVTFGIHSPTLLFAGEPQKGKTYDFSLRRSVVNGKAKFSGLRLRSAPESN